jgi:hypothetical protein
MFAGYLDKKHDCSDGGKSINPDNENAGSISVNAYPNPFLNTVNIEFASATDGHALLEIYNVLGERIAVLKNGPVEKDILNHFEYTPGDAPNGILYYRLILNSNLTIGKMIYVKE